MEKGKQSVYAMRPWYVCQMHEQSVKSINTDEGVIPKRLTVYIRSALQTYNFLCTCLSDETAETTWRPLNVDYSAQITTVRCEGHRNLTFIFILN